MRAGKVLGPIEMGYLWTNKRNGGRQLETFKRFAKVIGRAWKEKHADRGRA